MIIQCPHCGGSVPVSGMLGRPRLSIPVKKVYDSLSACRSVEQAAQKLGCSRGYVYKVLKENGLLPENLINRRV